jgi:hypothetical protein
MSFHHAWTTRRAAANISDSPHSVMTLTCANAPTNLAQALRSAQANLRDQWCLGVQPGQPFATAMKPVVRQRS